MTDTHPSCIFCNIIAGIAPAVIVYQNDDCLCLLPPEANAYGHTVIIPKVHCESLYDTPSEVLSALMTTCKHLAQHYRECINATGVNLLHASGIDAQQSAFHFHIHLLPRFTNDGIDAWPNLPVIHVDREVLLERLRVE
jgi:histidine triad (HIT) family protein